MEVSLFCNNKGKIKFGEKSDVTYKFTCPGCQRQYIGKTDRCILTCSNEPTTDYPLH